VTRRIALLAGVVIVALLAGACGGGGGGEQLTHEQYQQKLNQLVSEVGTETAAAIAAIKTATPATVSSLGEEFRTTADSLSDASQDFNDLNPPDDAKDANGLLVASLSALGNGFRQMGMAADNNDLAGVKALADAYPESGARKQFLTALDELEKAGYTVDTSGV